MAPDFPSHHRLFASLLISALLFAPGPAWASDTVQAAARKHHPRPAPPPAKELWETFKAPDPAKIFLPWPVGEAATHRLLMGLPDLGPGHAWTPTVSVKLRDETCTKWQHTYQGLRVWDSVMATHESRGAFQAPTPSPALATGDGGRLFMPGLPRDLRSDLAPHTLLAGLQKQLHRAEPFAATSKVERIIYPVYETLNLAPPSDPDVPNAAQCPRHVTGYLLADLVQPQPETGFHYILDAHQGGLLVTIPRVAELGEAAQGVGHTLYSGTVALPMTRMPDATFRLEDPTRGNSRIIDRGIKDYDPGTPVPPLADQPTLAHATAEWGDSQLEGPATPPASPTAQTIAADTMYGVAKIWDFYVNKVNGLGPLDDLDHGLTVDLHGPYFPDNTCFLFDSSTIALGASVRAWPNATLMLLGHEVTHGFLDKMNAPRYGRTEAGAINESGCDFMGMLIDTWARTGGGSRTPLEDVIGDADSTWALTQMPRDVSGGFEPLLRRSFYKPSMNGRAFDQWAPGFDGKDPHDTSGPLNRALFFLYHGASADPESLYYSPRLPEGLAPLGNDRTFDLALGALISLGPAATYLDARREILRQSRLPSQGGINSRENIAVRKAFGAVNVGNPNATDDGFDLTGSLRSTAELRGRQLVLTATVAEVPDVRSVVFKVDGLMVARLARPPYVLTLDPGRWFTQGAHTFQAILANEVGQVLDGPTVPFTLPPMAYEQILQDPGLENTDPLAAKWIQNFAPGPGIPQVLQDRSGRLPGAHGGNRCAVFDAAAGPITLFQRVTFPADKNTSELSFWIWSRPDPKHPDSSLTVKLLDDRTGVPLRTLATFDRRNGRPDWVRTVLPLGGMQGRTVDLAFIAWIPSTSAALFLVDDINLDAYGTVPLPAVSVLPKRVDLAPGASFHFRVSFTRPAGQALVWSLREPGGTQNMENQTCTPPAAPGFYHLVATSVADPQDFDEISIHVGTP